MTASGSQGHGGSAETARAAGVFVVGMHCGGTSAITGALVALGLGGPCDDVGPTSIHPHGKFESVAFWRLNEQLLGHFHVGWAMGRSPGRGLPSGWEHDPWVIEQRAGARELIGRAFPRQPWVIKDPRLCVLLPFWRKVVGDRAAALLIVRHPMEVARSLQRRDGIPMYEGLAIWEYHYTCAAEHLQGMPVKATTYDAALTDPDAWCRATASWLERTGVGPLSGVTGPAISYLDADVRRQVARAEDSGLLSIRQSALFESLLARCGDHESWDTIP